MRWWYLRRGVPWGTLGGVGLLGSILVAAGERWHGAAGAVLPFVIACVAVACAFLLDDRAESMVDVTPRGGRWALGTRLLLLPCLTVVGVLLARTGAAAAGVDPGAWTRVALAAGVAGCAAAGVLRTRDVPRPGALVANAVVVLVAAPLVLIALLDWPSPYPGAVTPAWVTALWTVGGVVAAGVLAGCWWTMPPRRS